MIKLSEIRELISENNLDKAFEQTLILTEIVSGSLHQNIVELKRQFIDWKQRHRGNLEARNEEINKITHSLLEVLNDVEKKLMKQNNEPLINIGASNPEPIFKAKGKPVSWLSKAVIPLSVGCLLGFMFEKLWAQKEEKLSVPAKVYDWNYDVRNVGALFFDDSALDDLNNYLEHTQVDGAGDSKYYYIRGRIYHQLGKWKEAVSEYQKSLNLDSNQVEVNLMLGRALMKIDDDDALKKFTTLINQNPMNIPIQYNYGVCLMKKFETTGNYDFLYSAKKTFNRVVIEDKACEILGAYHNYGQICVLLGDYDEGIIYLDKVIDKSPLFAKSYFFKGMALYKLNKKEEALKYIVTSFNYNKSLILSHKEIYSELIKDKNIGFQLKEYLKLVNKMGQ